MATDPPITRADVETYHDGLCSRNEVLPDRKRMRSGVRDSPSDERPEAQRDHLLTPLARDSADAEDDDDEDVLYLT
jgi:hypothetical protein